MKNGTVITADIINSTQLPKNEFKKFVKLIQSVTSEFKTEFYRGDSLQIYVHDNISALQILLSLRAAARRIDLGSGTGIDLRAGIGIGAVKGAVRTLTTSTEEPFVLSGRSFENIPSSAALAIQSSGEKANCAFRVIARFVDYIFKDLTVKQAAVLFELLKGRNQTDTARKLKKSKVTVNRQARAAGWAEIEKILIDYRTVLTEFDLL